MSDDNDSSQSQTLRAVLGLRGLIVDGEVTPGSRVSETLISDRFNVSRTPARMALNQMADEGLLERTATNRFTVKMYSETDIYQAIEIRGTLEGLAARYAAEGRATPSIVAEMNACVIRLDDVVDNLSDAVDQDDYVRLNDRFHELLVEASGSQMVARSLEKIKTLPFASANAFVKSLSLNKPSVQRVLMIAQEQHRAIVDCIRTGKGQRAEALALEHSFCAARYLQILRAFKQKIPWVSDETDVELPVRPTGAIHYIKGGTL
ncbi:GntR family transcriptional regulator [Agrobacterium rhizogenes]|uniref:GntR family transcriptional regulator n=1 Tax=Rhizobium rhizogenes TaxID=359 RepID=UPI001573F305|nr:GntR family transcriptional regulator [Rhizobium rhizogenes]NTH16715.1 GntR family transcriptional regulator [Rhizobium rhizogenes]